ncbi:unannotated protein [freshwater metagenome]|uniref:Unannotated protein n=1 Tax=freshwater metagenome TaxID=449393 RepID=A0A6J6IIY1_9ZZZZ
MKFALVKQLLTRASACKDSERGSLALLGIGLALVSLTAILAILSAGSLYLTDRRLTGAAEATALSVVAEANGNLSQPLEPMASRFLSQLPLRGLREVTLVDTSVDDERTVRVKLCSRWFPIFENYIFSENGKVCSEGLARLGR